MNTRVSIIIPVFNQAALTKRCLQAVGTGEFEIVVVDDASSDATASVLESIAPLVKTVRHSENQGFGASCNDGAAVASGDYLVFLNNDTIPQPGWLEALVAYANGHPRAAIVGSKLLYPDGMIQHAGVVICQDRYPRHIYTGFPADHEAVNKSRRFQIVTAACMLVRRKAFAQANGFDRGFRNGFEDVDLCLRLGDLGHEIHYCAQSVVQHLESVSAGRFKADRENVALYRERWLTRVHPDDVTYYLADSLLEFTYEGSFPLDLDVSPRLALLERAVRESQTERLLADYTRQIADLRRENARLSLFAVGSHPESETAQYDKLKRRIREAVQHATSSGATVLVVSKGDRSLLELEGRNAWHFPQTSKGSYAGHHPADSATAIAQLEALRSRGAEYLIFPKTAFWWLQHYREFHRHLEMNYQLVSDEPETCLIFELRRSGPAMADAPNRTGASRDSARAIESATLKETHDCK